MIPQGPSLYEAGGIPGLNPAQRPQLRAPVEEPPEMEPRQPRLPDHRYIMIIALITACHRCCRSFTTKETPGVERSCRRSPWCWNRRDNYRHTLPVISYFNPRRPAPHHDTFNRRAHCHDSFNPSSGILEPPKQPERERGEKILWIFVLWVVITIVSLVFGLRSVGIM